jgi:hypothetical protein
MGNSAAAKAPGVHVVSAVLLALAVAAAVVLAGRAKHEPRAAGTRTDPLTLVPPGPRLLISADVAGLMKVAASDLARLGGDKLLGLRKTCGFEPLLSLERAVFAMPFGDAQASSRGSDFALIAETRIDSKQGLQCAERVIAQRGGSPVRTTLGRFTSVRDSSKPLGEVAMRSDGLLVLSGGQYFRDVMDAAAATTKIDEAAKLRTQLHRSIRDKLGRSQLMLSLLPESSSVLRGVRALGLGLELGKHLTLRGIVACVSATACSQARAVIQDAKTELAKEPDLSGLGSVEVEQHEERLELAGILPREQLGPLLTQLITP